MHRIFTSVALVAAGLLAGTLVTAPHAQAAGRVALVVGNSAYQATSPLANPQNDATAMGEVLETLGFEVIVAVDADRRDFIAAMDDFSRLSVGADVAIFFYAGHGIQIGGENFLLPVDVETDSERALRYSAIDAQEIIADMERSANVSIAILDACRDNPLVDELARGPGASRSASVSRGLGRMTLSGRGALVAFAAAAGDTAADGAGDHSPYTAALLEEIDEPNVEVGLMFRRVARRVRDETRGDQQPELLVRLVDEVYLNPQQTAAAQTAPAEQAVADDGAAPQETVVAQVDTPAAPPATTADETGEVDSGPARGEIYFGNRVIRTPDWYAGVGVSEPTGWQSATPAAVADSDDNNTYGTAQYAPLAAMVEARQFPRYDNDWFVVEVPTAGDIIVDAAETPENIDLNARVWDRHHQTVANWQGAPRAGGALYARLPVPGPGSYWIETTDGGRDQESDQPYRMLIDFEPADDPFEPNGSRGKARPIPVEADVAIAIFPRYDADWFKVFVPEPGLLSVTATRVPDNLDINVRVSNLNGDVITNWVGPPRKGGDTVMDSPLAAPGVYMIEIRDGGDDAYTVDTFPVAFSFLPVPDFAEPNDSFGSAYLVEPGSSHRIATFPRYDADWLAIDVPHPGELTVEATDSPDNLNINVRIWDQDKEVVRNWFGPAREGGDVYDFADLPRPGRYFVEIRDGGDDRFSPDLYNLDLVYTAQADQYEPNNGQIDASPLTPGGTVPFNILPRYDIDWFRVVVPSPGELAVVIDESPEDLDINYRVWNDNREVIANWVPPYRKGGVTEGFADLPAPGTYYLEIRDGGDDARSVDHATLTTVFTPVADRDEPNNAYRTGAAIALGEPVHANILPRYDIDWYVLEAPRSGTFQIVVDQVDDDMDINLRLWNGEAEAGSWHGPPRKGGVTDAEIEVPAAGTYYLEVRDGGDDARSNAPYRMQVDFR